MGITLDREGKSKFHDSFIHSSIYLLFFHLRWSKPFQRRAIVFNFYLYFMSVYTFIIVWIFTLGTRSYLSSIEKTTVGIMTLFSLPLLFNFFFKNSLLFEAFKWLSFKYHSKSLWSILGQSQYLTFPKHTDWVRKRWMCSYWWSEVKSLSCIRLFATPWTVAYHAPPSMGFSRQEYWSRLSFPSSEDLPNSGIKPGSPGL